MNDLKKLIVDSPLGKHETDSAGPDVVRQRIESELKTMMPVVKSAGLLNKSP